MVGLRKVLPLLWFLLLTINTNSVACCITQHNYVSRQVNSPNENKNSLEVEIKNNSLEVENKSNSLEVENKNGLEFGKYLVLAFNICIFLFALKYNNLKPKPW